MALWTQFTFNLKITAYLYNLRCNLVENAEYLLQKYPKRIKESQNMGRKCHSENH